MSENDQFWSLLLNECGECECAKRDCAEKLIPNIYVHRFLKGSSIEQ